jgi:hypothetical protein
MVLQPDESFAAAVTNEVVHLLAIIVRYRS